MNSSFNIILFHSGKYSRLSSGWPGFDPGQQSQKLVNGKQQVHLSHIASNKYCSLHRDLCNTCQLSQLTTQLDNKVHKNTKKPFLYFYQTVGVEQEFYIDYLQMSRLDFIHFILIHSQTSQFQFHVKINSQEYSNPIPNDFEPMITH